MSITRLAAVCLASLLTACAGTSSSSSSPSTPTAPSTPTPTAPTLTFTSDTAAHVGQSVGITLASTPSPTPGIFRLAISGFNLKNDHVSPGTGAGVRTVCARVKWYGALLELTGGGPGDFLRQGGATVIVSQPPASSQAVEGSTHAFCVHRGSGAVPPLLAYGSGEIWLFGLRLREGVTSGTSTVEFVEGSGAYPHERVLIEPALPAQAYIRYQPLVYYGGTISIR